MTTEKLIELLHWHASETKMYVCHYAKRAGQAKPIVRPLATLRWLKGRLCLVEEDDRGHHLASI